MTAFRHDTQRWEGTSTKRGTWVPISRKGGYHLRLENTLQLASFFLSLCRSKVAILYGQVKDFNFPAKLVLPCDVIKSLDGWP